MTGIRMRGNYPDLDTPIGQVWLTAASVEHAVASPSLEGNPYLKQEVARLAHATKLLAEIVERELHRRQT